MYQRGYVQGKPKGTCFVEAGNLRLIRKACTLISIGLLVAKKLKVVVFQFDNLSAIREYSDEKQPAGSRRNLQEQSIKQTNP